MTTFSADIVKFDGLGVTYDLRDPFAVPDTDFTRFLSNYRHEDGYNYRSACLVAEEEIALRLVPHNYQRTPTSELEAQMVGMQRGITAHVIPGEIKVDTEGVSRDYDRRSYYNHSRYPRPLMTIAIGGTATFRELGIASVPINIDRMLLHPPTDIQRLIRPRVNLAELGPLPRLKHRS